MHFVKPNYIVKPNLLNYSANQWHIFYDKYNGFDHFTTISFSRALVIQLIR